MQAQTINIAMTPEASLSRYLQEIRKFPMLTADEEVELAWRVRKDEDREAFDRLVNSHLRLVAKIALGYRGYGLPVGELISEGNVGMIQAVERFDPSRGFRLSTYAMWWVRAAIQEYILHSWSLVKMGTTAAQKKLFFNLRRIKSEMRAYEEGDLLPEQVEDIATRLKVPEAEVVSMNQRLAYPDHSLNAPLRDDRDNQETLFGNGEELLRRRRLLVNAMHQLQERERHILSERRLKERPETLETLSQRYGISRERVRQIEVRAFEKLQKTICGGARAEELVDA